MHRTGSPTVLDRAAVRILGLAHSTWYHRPAGESAENLALMRRIDEQYLRTPFYGSRKLAEVLGVNRKRIQRLMRPWASKQFIRSGVRPGPAPGTRFTHIYCGMWRSRGPTRCGPATSPTCRCGMDFCTSWR